MVFSLEARYKQTLAAAQQGQGRAIAALLNDRLQADPALEVSGQPPILNIFIAEETAPGDARFWQQLAATLQELRLTTYREVHVYATGLSPLAPRRLKTLTLEAPAPTLETLMPPLPPMESDTPPPPSKPPVPPNPIRQRPSVKTSSVRQPPVPPQPTQPKQTPAPPHLPQGQTAPSRRQQPRMDKAAFPRHKPRRKGGRLGMAAGLILSSLILGGAIAQFQQQRSPGRQSVAAPEVPPAPPIPALEPNLPEQDRGEREPGFGDRLEPVDPNIPTVPEPEPLPTSAAVPAQPLTPITQETGLGAAAALLATPKQPTVAVTLKAVGDIIPGTNFPDYRLPDDPNYLFDGVKTFLGETDLLFGNFESTLTDYPYSAKDISQGMTFAFRTPPGFAPLLQDAGFDVLSVANNHAVDFAEVGFNDTIAHIEQAGMAAVGRRGQIVTINANDHTVAFVGFSYLEDHNSMHDLPTAIALVQTAQAQADMVVVSVHAGAEGTDALRVRNQTEYFFSENRGNLVQFSRTMVDAGADVILGHGPHVPRAIELYQDKLIAYSLGNFLGYRTLSTVGPLGTSLILQVDLDEGGDFLGGRIIPVALDPNGVPYIDNFFQSVILVRQLTREDFPETPLEIDEMGYILRTDR